MSKDPTSSALSQCCGANVHDVFYAECVKCNKPCTLSAGGGKSLAAIGVTEPSLAVLSTDPKPTISGEEVECASSLEKVAKKNGWIKESRCSCG